MLAPLRDVRALEGQGAVLECSLGGQPAPDVTWYRGDSRLDTERRPGRFSAQLASGRATLTLQEVALADGGVYTCVCSNQFGEASTRSCLLVKRESRSWPSAAGDASASRAGCRGLCGSRLLVPSVLPPLSRFVRSGFCSRFYFILFFLLFIHDVEL